MKKLLLIFILILSLPLSANAWTTYQHLTLDDGLKITDTLNGSTDEYALRLDYTVNKSAGNDYGMYVNMMDTASPGTSYLAWWGVNGNVLAYLSNNGQMWAKYVKGNVKVEAPRILTSALGQRLDIQDYRGPFDTAGDIGVRFLNSTTFTNTSGDVIGIQVNPTINQASGTGSYSAFVVDPTETAVGSGGGNLMDLRIGGVSKFKVTNKSHFVSSGTTPVLSACGTAPAITGSDSASKVTIGTGVTTSCTVTFANAYTAAPACVITGDDAAIGYAAITTTTVLTITSSADMDSDVISVICMEPGA